MGTIKEYYNKGYLAKLKAKIVSINGNKIELDKTIAFPEGGGQEGDKGIITLLKSDVEFEKKVLDLIFILMKNSLRKIF